MKLGTFDTNNWYSGEHTKRNGNTPANVHIIPDSIPEDLAFFDGSTVIAKTQIERNTYDLAQADLAETAKQAAKPDALKQAENDYFALIDTINSVESLNVLHSDNSAEIMQKANALSMTKKSYYGVLLQNTIREVELKGGSWYELPSQSHNLEA